MATSGTVGRTQLDAATFIEHAARACGVLTPLLSAEHLITAKELLFMVLSNLTNKGINLWCVKRMPLALEQGKARYRLPEGTLDLLDSQFRTGVYTAATSIIPGIATIDYGSGGLAYAINGTLTAATAGDYALVIESSSDGVTWAQRGEQAWQDVAVGDLIGVDADPSPLAQYWRVRETVLVTTFTACTFTSAAREIPISPYSRDNYESLPDKAIQSGAIPNIYYDRQIPRPVLVTWPTMNAVGPQIALSYIQQIQDVGALSNTLEIPQRYFLFIVYELAVNLFPQLPAKMRDKDAWPMITFNQAKYEKEAADGDTDGAPIMMAPNIGGYTK